MTTATQTQIRRDTAANLGVATPASGELGWDTTNKRLVVGDGSTAGGNMICMAKDVQNMMFDYATVGGTANAITLTNSPAKAALQAGQQCRFKATADNTTTVTIAEDSLSAKAVKYMINGTLTALPAGAIKSGMIVECDYDGTQYQLNGGINPPLGSSSTFGPVLVDGSTITASGGVISASSGLMNPLAVGSIILAEYTSSASLSAGGTTAASNLSVAFIPLNQASPNDLSTTLSVLSGDGISGTWKALQTVPPTSGGTPTSVGLFQRIS